jgi:hypothetical protein
MFSNPWVTALLGKGCEARGDISATSLLRAGLGFFPLRKLAQAEECDGAVQGLWAPDSRRNLPDLQNLEIPKDRTQAKHDPDEATDLATRAGEFSKMREGPDFDCFLAHKGPHVTAESRADPLVTVSRDPSSPITPLEAAPLPGSNDNRQPAPHTGPQGLELHPGSPGRDLRTDGQRSPRRCRNMGDAGRGNGGELGPIPAGNSAGGTRCVKGGKAVEEHRRVCSEWVGDFGHLEGPRFTSKAAKAWHARQVERAGGSWPQQQRNQLGVQALRVGPAHVRDDHGQSRVGGVGVYQRARGMNIQESWQAAGRAHMAPPAWPSIL